MLYHLRKQDKIYSEPHTPPEHPMIFGWFKALNKTLLFLTAEHRQTSVAKPLYINTNSVLVLHHDSIIFLNLV